MGFKLGRFLQKGVKSVLKRGPQILTGFVAGGPVGAVGAALAPRPKVTGAATFTAPGTTPGIMRWAGPSVGPMGDVEVGPGEVLSGGVTPAGVPAVVAGLSAGVIRAITSLGLVLGLRVTALNVTRVGMRAWRVVTGFARRHPGLSVITFLTSLGLAAEEAVEFLAWGEARARRRRRRRGLSAADMRITRRTMRRLIRFHSDLRAIAGPGARGRRRSGGGAITAVSAGG